MKQVKKFFTALVLLVLLAGGAFVYARYVEPNVISTNRSEVSTGKQIAPFKIVFFSDTHFGALYDQTKMEKIVAKINREQPDLVLFGGDFFDAYASDTALLDLDYLSGQLAEIDAKYAKLAVWGNHDYGGGAVRVYEQLMEGGGFEVLRNQSITLEELRVTVTGLDDFLLGNPQTELAESLSSDYFQIVASHAPDLVDSMDLTQVGLVLAGHSHGGQVSLPLITKKILPPGAKNYVKGWYSFGTGTQLLVSKGLGLTSLPYRFLNVPEINVIEAGNGRATPAGKPPKP